MAPVPRELADRLYTTHPDRFVAARNDAVAAARSAGDAEAARDIARLRKPTVAAWLVNLLALRRPELMAELVGLAEALRRAQRELRGEQLRGLATQRRELVGKLVAQARALAAQEGAGRTPGKPPLADVEATLYAALADEEVARQVRSGRLVRPVSYAGFGEVPRPRLRLLTGGAAADAGDEESAVRQKPADRGRRDRAKRAERDRVERAERERVERERTERERVERAERERAARDRAAELAARRRALRQELTAARKDQQHAEKELARLEAEQQAGMAALAELETRLAELERRRAAAENEVSRGKLAHKAAQRALDRARRRVDEVQAALEALEPKRRAGRDR